MKLTQEELKEILDKHALWLKDSSKGERADLSNAYLFRANLSNADLCGADLSYANLSNADLSNANLSNADLFRADLSNVHLSNADLSFATLRNADLSNANLSSADLSNVDLYRANLYRANLSLANLSNVKNFTQQHLFKIAPEYGPFCIYKKVIDDNILCLIVHAEAQRVNAYSSRKIRVSRAMVLKAWDTFGNEITDNDCTFAAKHDRTFMYQLGKEVSVADFNDDMSKGCAPGIHGFLTKQEAIDY